VTINADHKTTILRPSIKYLTINRYCIVTRYTNTKLIEGHTKAGCIYKDTVNIQQGYHYIIQLYPRGPENNVKNKPRPPLLFINKTARCDKRVYSACILH